MFRTYQLLLCDRELFFNFTQAHAVNFWHVNVCTECYLHIMKIVNFHAIGYITSYRTVHFA
jgi:hypothetical protein